MKPQSEGQPVRFKVTAQNEDVVEEFLLDILNVIDYKFIASKTHTTLEINMKTITRSCIRLDVRVQNKDEAIQRAGQLLAEAGYIELAYIDSLLKREQVANTFL
ncbi:MAG TPA: PTS sugar transporter subunit IIA, partial [Candidatus Competibacteraceae bacterium]|nr:PTS sugar transporter subunit IIA [Candidatus Competibacteraceae bacterium]